MPKQPLNRLTLTKKNETKLRSSWLANATKTLTGNAVETVGNITPNLFSITTTITDVTRNVRKGKRLTDALSDMLGNNSYMKDIKKGLDNLGEDLKSGTFDNKSRSSFGSDDTSYNFGDMDESEGSASTAASAVDILADVNTQGFASVDSSIRTQTNMQVKMTKAGIDAGIHNTATILTSFEQSSEKTINVLNNINSGIQAMVEYQSTINGFIEASIAYYGEASKKEEESDNDVKLRDVIGKDGKISLDNLFKMTNQRSKAAFENSLAGQIMQGLGLVKDELISNPLKVISQALIEKTIPEVVKESIASLDKTLGSSAIESFVKLSSKLRDNTDEGLYGDFLRFLGNATDLRAKKLQDFDTEGKITTDKAVFDGVTRTAITSEIPRYLREISAYSRGIYELNGGDHKAAIAGSYVLNRETGRYQRYDDYKKELAESIDESVISTFKNSDFGKTLSDISKNMSEQLGTQSDAYNKLIEKLYLKLEDSDSSYINNEQDKQSDKYEDSIYKIIDDLEGDENLKKLLRKSVEASYEPTKGGNTINGLKIISRENRNSTIEKLGNNEINNFADVMGEINGRTGENDNNINKVLADILRPESTTDTASVTPIVQISDKVTSIESLLQRGIFVHNVGNKKAASWGQRNSGSPIIIPSGNNDEESTDNTSAADFSNLSIEDLLGRRNESNESEGDEKVSKKVSNKVNAITRAIEYATRGDEDKAHEELYSLLSGTSADIMDNLRDKFGSFRNSDKGDQLKDELSNAKDKVKNTISEGLDNWSKVLFGEDKSFKAVSEELKAKIAKNKSGMVKGAAIGAGVGLTSGGILGTLIGGPITGAILGTAGSFIVKSDAFQNFVFGEPDAYNEDGTVKSRAGGLVSKATQQLFKDNKGYIAKASIGGAVIGTATGGGLLGTLVGGPIGGALLGMGAGLVTKSDAFQNFLFGEPDASGERKKWSKATEGIIGEFNKLFRSDKDASDKEHGRKAFTMGVTGSGIGLLAGMFTPLGPLGGALAGLGASMFAAKDNFHDFLFGDKERKKKTGETTGVLPKFMNVINASVINPLTDKIKDGLEDVKDIFADKILGPLEVFARPLMNFAKGITDRIHDGIKDIFASIKDKLDVAVSTLAKGISKVAGTLFGPFTRIITGAFKAVLKAPGKLFEGAGEMLNAVNRGMSRRRVKREMDEETLDMQLGNMWDERDSAGNLTERAAAIQERYKNFKSFKKDYVETKYYHTDIEKIKARYNSNYNEKTEERKAKRDERKQRRETENLIAGITGGAFTGVNKADQTDEEKAKTLEEAKAKALEEYKRSKAGANRKGWGKLKHEDVLARLSPTKNDDKSDEGSSEDVKIAREELKLVDIIRSDLGDIKTGLFKILGLPVEAAKSGIQKASEKSKENKDKKTQAKLDKEKFLSNIHANVDSGYESLLAEKTRKDATKLYEEAAKLRNDPVYSSVGKEYYNKFKKLFRNADYEEVLKYKKAFEDAKKNAVKEDRNEKISEYNERKSDYISSVRTSFVNKLYDAAESAKTKIGGLFSRNRGGNGGFGLPGYAEGGKTKPGVAVVGEKGPEVVQFAGNERVLPNDETLNVNIVGIDKKVGDIDVNISGQDGLLATYGTSAKFGDRTDKASQIKESIEKPDTLVDPDNISSDSKDYDKKEEKEEKSFFEKVTEKISGIFSIPGLATFLEGAKVIAAAAGAFALLKNVDWGGIKDTLSMIFNNNARDGGTNFITNLKNQGNRLSNAVDGEAGNFLWGNKVAEGGWDDLSSATVNAGATATSKVLRGKGGKVLNAVGRTAQKVAGVGSRALLGDSAAATAMVAARNGIKFDTLNNMVEAAANGTTVGGTVGKSGKAATALLEEQAELSAKFANSKTTKVGNFIKTGLDKSGTAFKTISGFLQNAVKFIIEQLTKRFPKIGSATTKITGILDDILKGIAKATGKAAKWVGEKIGKLMAWISAKTGLDAVAIGFAITGAQVTLGALNNSGKAGAAKLFQCDQDDVDGTMRVISAVIAGLKGTLPGTVLDVVNEIGAAILGVDAISEVAFAIYKIARGEEEANALKLSKEKVKAEYLEYKENAMEEEYQNYLSENGITEEQVSREDFEQKVATGEVETNIKGFETWHDDNNQTVGDKVMKGIGKAGAAVKKGVTWYKDRLVNNFNTTKDFITNAVTSIKESPVGKVIGKTITDGTTAGKAILTGFSNITKAYDQASVNGSFDDYIHASVNTLDEDNPYYGTVNSILNISKGMMFPILLSKNVLKKAGKTIGKYISPVIDGAVSIGKAGFQEMQDAPKIMLSGNVVDLFRNEHINDENEKVPFATLLNSIFGVLKLPYVIPTMLIGGGKNLFNAAKKTFNFIKTGLTGAKTLIFDNLLPMTLAGDSNALANYNLGIPDDVPMAGIINGTFELVKMPFMGISKFMSVVHAIGDKAKPYIDVVKSGLSIAAGIGKDMYDVAKTGDIEALNNMSLGISNDAPMAPIINVGYEIAKSPFRIIAALSKIGSGIKSAASFIADGFSGMKTAYDKDMTNMASLSNDGKFFELINYKPELGGGLLSLFTAPIMNTAKVIFAIPAMIKGIGSYVKNKAENLWGGIKTFLSSLMKSTADEDIESTSGGNGGFGDVPFYSQKDPRWKNIPYEKGGKGETMSDAGCGPTAFAMAASGATSGNITPIQSANLLKSVGARDNTGTNWTGIGKAANRLGIKTEMQTSPSTGFIDKQLAEGKPVILSGRSGGYGETPYTSQGHYVVATGTDNAGNYIINDPNKTNGPRAYSKDDIISETGAAWGFGGRGKRGYFDDTSPITINGHVDDQYSMDDSDWASVSSADVKKNKIAIANKRISHTNASNILYGNDSQYEGISDDNDRLRWISIVKAVKKAIADKHPEYSQTTYITISIGGKSLKVRTDCSGFVAACLKYFGVLDDNDNVASITLKDMNNTTMKKTGFTPMTWPGWDNLVEGDILAINDGSKGHTEIFAYNDGNNHYVYNNGSTEAIASPVPTLTSHRNGYQVIWRPGAAGNAVNAIIDYSGSTYEPAITANNNDSGSPYTGNFLTDIGTFFSRVGSRIKDKLFGKSNTSTNESSTSSGTTGTYGNNYTGASVNISASESARQTFAALKDAGATDAGAAGVLGNFEMESGNRTNNLQNSYEKSLGMSDEQYTTAVDNGSYTNFANDSAGYGLAQWTYSTRKKGLLDYARSKGTSIADPNTQIGWLMEELKGHTKSRDDIMTSTSPEQSAEIFMRDFERPAEATAHLDKRMASARAYYDKYGNDKYKADTEPTTKAQYSKGNLLYTEDSQFEGLDGYGGKGGSDCSVTPIENEFDKNYEKPIPDNNSGNGGKGDSASMTNIENYLRQIIDVLGVSSNKLDKLDMLKNIQSGNGGKGNSSATFNNMNVTLGSTNQPKTRNNSSLRDIDYMNPNKFAVHQAISRGL